MEPEEFFHDHPVIDRREEGIYMYWSDMPPVLLKCPYINEPTEALEEDKKATECK